MAKVKQQSATGDELRPLFGSPSEVRGMPGILDKAFKGEL